MLLPDQLAEIFILTRACIFFCTVEPGPPERPTITNNPVQRNEVHAHYRCEGICSASAVPRIGMTAYIVIGGAMECKMRSMSYSINTRMNCSVQEMK